MLTSKQCYDKYGTPVKESNMILWNVPRELQFTAVPKKIYCNKDLVAPLTNAFKNIINKGLQEELKSWDGCFNIRNKRQGDTPSLHSWGVAIDINAAWNKMGKTPTLSEDFVNCFKEAGFDWGGEWDSPDGMHFQLKKI